MRWFELTFLLIVGALFFYVGWEIWKKKKISLIHEYHHKKVKEEDKKPYTAQIGKALLSVGVGLVLTGVIDFLTNTLYGWWIFAIAFCVGVIRVIYAQMKYNHGLF